MTSQPLFAYFLISKGINNNTYYRDFVKIELSLVHRKQEINVNCHQNN